MQELWRKPDTVNVNDFDGSFFPYLLRAQVCNECKVNVEEQRNTFFSSTPEVEHTFTEEEMNRLREKLGAGFVLEQYSKKELVQKLRQESKKTQRSVEREE